MDTRTRFEAGPFGLAPEATARLLGHVEAAVRLARARGRRNLAAVTVPIPAAVDLSATALAARDEHERLFCLEHPDRGGFALATVGCAALLQAAGPGRFGDLVASTQALSQGAFADESAQDPDRPAHAGPAWVGGFAFANDGGSGPDWSGLAPVNENPSPLTRYE
jgi:hypothetical protein